MPITFRRLAKFPGGVAAFTTWTPMVIACLLTPSALLAQNLTGEIDGTIHDSSGGVIPNAAVTVKNTDQNTVVRTV